MHVWRKGAFSERLIQAGRSRDRVNFSSRYKTLGRDAPFFWDATHHLSQPSKRQNKAQTTGADLGIQAWYSFFIIDLQELRRYWCIN